jgi:hypothetical protein
MKAMCSNEASAWVDVLRRSCGGHGYLLSSNLPKIFATVTASCTYEGENTVLWLQVARFANTPGSSLFFQVFLSFEIRSVCYSFSTNLIDGDFFGRQIVKPDFFTKKPVVTTSGHLASHGQLNLPIAVASFQAVTVG